MNKAKRQSKMNTKKDKAYASLFTLVGFVGSIVYMIIEVIYKRFFVPSDQFNIPAIITFVIFIPVFIFLYFYLKKLRKGIEDGRPEIKKICDGIEKLAQESGYFSHILFVFTLFVAIVMY